MPMTKEQRIADTYLQWDRMREREERVVQNIPEDLIPLWERTKRQFKGTPHERYEAFMEYAEMHDGEAVAALEEQAEEAVERLLAAYHAEVR